jgi:hypothetical protein
MSTIGVLSSLPKSAHAASCAAGKKKEQNQISVS